MPDQAEIMEWRGCEVIDRDGDKVGRLDEIYVDRETGKPEWAIVNTGLFGRKSSFVPLAEAIRDGGMIRVPYEAQQVKDAPSVDPDGEISLEEEQAVYSHYGLDYSQNRSGSGLPDADTSGTGQTATDVPGQATTGTAQATTDAPDRAGMATEQTSAPGEGTAGDVETTSGTAGTQTGNGAGMRLQRAVREDVQVGANDDGVVQRRTIQEERLVSDPADSQEETR